MHNYKGQLRRDFHDNTPTKSSWEREKQQAPSQRHESRLESKYQTKQDQRYEPRPEHKYETKFEKSQLSYYQSQSSRVYYDPERSEKPTIRSNAYAAEDKYLFNELMLLRIKQFDREEYEQTMRVQIQSKIQKGVSALVILITDDIKPTFLWQFHMRESEFLGLKNQQKLKVSYAGFPEMLQNCFRECLEVPEYHGQKNNHLLLEIKKGGEGILSVLESNRYKQSVHLYLYFKMASDEDVKNFLASKLILAQDELKQNKRAMSNMENALNQRMFEVNDLSSQLNSLKREGQKHVEQILIREKQKMNDMKENSINQTNKIKRQLQLELKETRHKLTGEIELLKRQRDQWRQKHADVKSKLDNSEAKQRQQRRTIGILEQEVSKHLKDCDNLRSQNRDLSEKRHQNEKSIAELTCRLQSLKSEIEDKKTIIDSTKQNKETISSQISTLESQNTEQKKQIIKLETKITQLQGQISRLSSNNSDLTDKIGRQKQKLHQRVEVIKEQESQLRQIKKKETDLSRENDDLKYKNIDKEKKIQGLQEQLQIIQKKLGEQTSMVFHLQKQLNERSMRSGPFYSATTYQPSAPYSNLNRELPSQLSNNSSISTSRVALSSTNLRQEKIADKYEPNIKRYQQRSKSPVPKRLTQQREPEDDDLITDKSSAFEQPRPVKFKMSQPRE